MTRRKVAAFGLCLALIIAGAIRFVWPPQTQVIGTLSSHDLAKVKQLAREEVRSWARPKLTRGDAFHPANALGRFRDYQRQHILWLQVRNDGIVEVFFGAGKNVIREEGHVVDLRKTPSWQVCGYAYWSTPTAAPRGLQVPP